MDIDRFGISKIVRHYTKEHQIEKAKEELEELFDALDEEDVLHIAEEMADVLVMIVQLMRYMQIRPELVENMMDYKVMRQLRRIEKEVNADEPAPGSVKKAFNEIGGALKELAR